MAMGMMMGMGMMGLPAPIPGMPLMPGMPPMGLPPGLPGALLPGAVEGGAGSSRRKKSHRKEKEEPEEEEEGDAPAEEEEEQKPEGSERGSSPEASASAPRRRRRRGKDREPERVEEVERFIRENRINEEATSKIRALSPDSQRKVIARPLTGDVQNPSKVMIARVRELQSQNERLKGQDVWTMWGSAMMGATPEAISRFVEDNDLDESAARQLRALPPHLQATALRWDLSSYRNRSAKFMSMATALEKSSATPRMAVPPIYGIPPMYGMPGRPPAMYGMPPMGMPPMPGMMPPMAAPKL